VSSHNAVNPEMETLGQPRHPADPVSFVSLGGSS